MTENQEQSSSLGKLRTILVDILNGYSIFKFQRQKDSREDAVYLKHLTLYDAADIDNFKYNTEQEAKSKGLETEKEKLDQLKEDELWTDKEDSRIKELSGYITNLSHSKSKLFLRKEIEQINSEAKSSEEELKRLTSKR